MIIQSYNCYFLKFTLNSVLSLELIAKLKFKIKGFVLMKSDLYFKVI